MANTHTTKKKQQNGNKPNQQGKNAFSKEKQTYSSIKALSANRFGKFFSKTAKTYK
jgi:hypothetical protein